VFVALSTLWTQAQSPTGSFRKIKISPTSLWRGHRVGLDDTRILEVESNSKCRKYKESAHMASLINRISQPSLDISPIWISLISNEVSNSQRRSVWRDKIFLSFHKVQSRVFRFYSTDGASGRYYMSSQVSSSFLCIGAHALGFVAQVCSTNFYLIFCPSSTHVRALSQFLLYIFLSSPAVLA
jgi:hypothetical protein